MKIYLAGGINGNLKPLWNNIVNSSNDFKELEYKYENFWRGGESRHWLHNELISPTKEKGKDYEDVSSRSERNALNSTEYYRGGL